MNCYLEDYRARMDSWAERTSWVTSTTWHTSQVNGRVISCLGTIIVWASTLAVLLVNDGLDKNPGPGVKGEKILQVLCRGCDRNIKSRTQCNTCGRCFHNNCANIKAKVTESVKWICDKCRSDRLRLLGEKLQNA
jgi:hypothetical protein